MKGEFILDSIGNANEKYIEEASKAKRLGTKNVLLKFGITAACVCIAAGGFFASKALHKAPNIIAPGVITDTDNTDANEVIISGILAFVSEDRLFEQSSLVVSGTFSGDTFLIVRNIDGAEHIFTDYEFTADKVYRGDAPEKITVRINGGTADGNKVTYEASPLIEKGKEYLLFLYRPNYGGTFNTDGDYFYIVGEKFGIFEKINGDLVSQMGYGITVDQVEERADDYPVIEDFVRIEFLENQKRNFENGIISEEEYNKVLENIDVYAETVGAEANGAGS